MKTSIETQIEAAQRKVEQLKAKKEAMKSQEKQKKTNKPQPISAGTKVLVRAYSAGVHFGTLQSIDGKQVVLTDARNLWRWRGANSLREVANNGCNIKEYTKITESVPVLVLTEAIEIIPMSDRAYEMLNISVWG